MTSPLARGQIAVVYDINVYLDHIRSGAGMLLPDRLPSPSAASDALSLAFDQQVRLFASPHILRNIHRLMLASGQSERTTAKFIEFIAEACQDSGGGIVDPVVRDHAIGDHEDNHILALAKDPAVDADVIVSSDHHLIDLGPAWNGRLMMRPQRFVAQMLRSVGHSTNTQPVAQTVLAPQASRASRAPIVPKPKRVSDAFPELRGVHLDSYGLSGSPAPRQADDLQR